MTIQEWPGEGSPFHAGEREVQARVVGAENVTRVERAGRAMIRPFMPEQHREFFAKLPFVILGTRDAQGQPWASLLADVPGFLDTPDAQHLTISTPPLPGDDLAARLQPGAQVGILGIEPHTRRRNRANGEVLSTAEGVTRVWVRQSFGNCPKYIQARAPRFLLRTPGEPSEETNLLSEEARALLSRCDTLFLATSSPQAGNGDAREGVDVSHRGGKPGFVKVEVLEHGTRLTIPDFSGNFMFNTLGNLVREPRVGLLVPDFDTGDLLQLVGLARLVWEGRDLASFAGAERLVQFDILRGRFLRGVVPLVWSAPILSPHLEHTGAW
jgi:hypothetical protein